MFIEYNHLQGHLKGTETDIIAPLVDFMVYCNVFKVWLNSCIRKVFLEATINICIVIYKLHACTIWLIYQVHEINTFWWDEIKRNIKNSFNNGTSDVAHVNLLPLWETQLSRWDRHWINRKKNVCIILDLTNLWRKYNVMGREKREI